VEMVPEVVALLLELLTTGPRACLLVALPC